MTDSSSDVRKTLGAARLLIWVIGLWILLGASFKLFYGTPNDLPALVRDVPLAIGTTYRLVIAIELAFVCLAFLKPRWAWPFLIAQLVVFDAILISQLVAGSANCGCFGSKVSMSPGVMLAIDSVLLVALVFARPWTTLRTQGAPLSVVAVTCAVLITAPWALNRQIDPVVLPPEVGVPLAAGGDTGGDTGGWVELNLAAWVGKDIGETPLARWLDVYTMPPDALWVLYRLTCDHCAEHLEQLALEEVGERYLVLLRLKEAHDSDENRVVHRVPEGDFVFHAELPDSAEYVITTPGELVVEGFRVIEGVEGVGTHD